MSKLLNKQLKTLSIFALIILMCSIPVYYFVIETIWLGELDDHNALISQSIEERFSNSEVNDEELENVLSFWDALQAGTQLEPLKNGIFKADSIYEVEREDIWGDGEMERFRVLQSTIKINDKNYLLTVETNVEEASETIFIISIITVVFVLLMIIGFILINRKISAKIWGPFQSTLEKLKKFQLADESALSFEPTQIIEFAELNAELELLIKNNIAAYQKQKRFVENASHELQTPIAVLKSKLDLLLQSKDLSEEQSKIVSAIALPLSRISRLNKNLLILAKIENHQYKEEEELNLNDLLSENMEMLDDYIQSKGLNFTIVSSEQINLHSNKFLLETLLNNLLTNAIKNSAQNETVRIELIENSLIISNAGTQTLDQKKIFERFSNVSNESGNSGLGLSIIKEICSYNNWSISYEFEKNQHIFKVNF
ncbi:MAG: HAMP domain-containing sensor histidine kinase [Crocinitomicaceae bacterium]|nr:HAMP domain-containing histidine kinase [Crocinitomicaceae bacterium]